MLGFWEEALADISAGQHINYETGFDHVQILLNHKASDLDSAFHLPTTTHAHAHTYISFSFIIKQYGYK
jgi:hypothetical protein